jgi:type IV secretory pathway TrbD component
LKTVSLSSGACERPQSKEIAMDNSIIGLVAVVMALGIPLGAMYTFYRVRKLRTEERLAAIARGANVPIEPELSPIARSRKAGILLVSGALGYILTFGLIAQIEHEPETWVAAAFGIIPLAVGIGYFIDFTLNRSDARTTG